MSCESIHTALGRWPAFAPGAINTGIGSVFALPMRLRAHTIGSLNLLRTSTGPLDADDVLAAQAIADVATIGILQHRVAQEGQALSEQLQYALDSRIVIEQAKGVLAASSGLDMDAAFSAVRQYARNHNQLLTDVARAIVARELSAESVTPH